MKKNFYLLAIILVTLFFVACDKDDDEKNVSRIEIVEGVESQSGNGKILQMNVGEKIQLHVNHFPEKLDHPNYTWNSSNTNVVQISYGGYVKAISTGSSTITISTELGVETKCLVKVGLTAVKEIKLETDDKLTLVKNTPKDFYHLDMRIDETYTLNPTVTPDTASYKYNLAYSTIENGMNYDNMDFVKYFKESNIVKENEILEIRGENFDSSTSGTIIPKSVGSSEVVIISPDSLYVNTLIRVDINPVFEKDIILSDSVITLEKDETKDITVKIEPENTTFKQLDYKIVSNSDNPIVNCQIIEHNTIRIEAIEEGNIKIDVFVSSGMCRGVNYGQLVTNIKKTINVNVIPKTVKGLDLEKYSINVVKGTSSIINASIIPSDAKNQMIHWKCDNTDVLEIEPHENFCLLFGKNEGTNIYVTATTDDGNIQKTCVVNVGTLTNFISSENTGISTVFKYNSSPKNELTLKINNNSNVDINLIKCDIINPDNGIYIAGCTNFTNPVLYANSAGEYTISGFWNVDIGDNSKPIVITTIEYNGESYEIRSKYSTDYQLHVLGF